MPTTEFFQEAAARFRRDRGDTGGGTTPRFAVRAASLLILPLGLLLGVDAPFHTAAAIGVRLSGRVTDVQGQPVPLTDLDFYYSGTRDKIDPTPRGVPPQSDKSDIDGNYGLIVREDLYDLRFQPPAGRDDLATIIVERVELAADTTVDVVLPRGFALTGTLRDDSGIPAPFVSIQVTDEISGVRMPTPGNQTALDGSYAVVVRPGRYGITFAPPDGSRLVPRTVRGFQLDAPRRLDATLIPGFFLDGFVVDDQERPLRGIDLDVDLLPAGERLRTRNDQTDDTGRYRILVPGGSVGITYNPPFGLPLAADTRGPVTVVADASLPTVRLSRGIRITGLVTDPSGRPLAGARARFARASDGGHVPAPWSTSDADGRLDFQLLPDRYRVVLAPPPGVALDSLALGEVDLRQDSDVAWGWVGSRLWSLSVRLRTAAGAEPVPGRVTVWHAPRSGAPLLDAAVDAAGEVQLQLAEGDFDVVARVAPGFEPDSVVLAGIRLDHDLELTAAFQTDTPSTPRLLVIAPPAPNPFRGAVRLTGTGPAGATVLIQVFDARGRRIRRLAEEPMPVGGLEWDGRADDGRPAPAGHYFIRFELPDGYRQTRRVVRLPH